MIEKNGPSVRGEIADNGLHLNNYPKHTILRVQQFLVRHNLATLPQPPYGLNMS